MENCLKTRLKEVVNNDSLVIEGHLKIKVSQKSSVTANMSLLSLSAVNTGCDIKVTGNGYFADTFAGLSDPGSRYTSKHIDGNGNLNTLYFANGDYYIDISDKENIVSVVNSSAAESQTIFSISIDQFYCPNLRKIEAPLSDIHGSISGLSLSSDVSEIIIEGINIVGDISVLGNANSITSFYISKANVTGNISTLIGKNSLSLLVLSDTKVSGNVSSLNGLNALTNVQLENTIVSGDVKSIKSPNLGRLDIRNTNISGTIEELAAALWNNGSGRGAGIPASGTPAVTYVYAKGSNVTYNGQAINNAYCYLTFNKEGYNIAEQ